MVLRHWGFNGTFVASSINSTAGTFQMTINGFAGLLVPQTVTVYTSGITTFRNGFTALGTSQATCAWSACWSRTPSREIQS